MDGFTINGKAKNNPCKECDKHCIFELYGKTVRCHSVCSFWEKWEEQHKEVISNNRVKRYEQNQLDYECR